MKALSTTENYSVILFLNRKCWRTVRKTKLKRKINVIRIDICLYWKCIQEMDTKICTCQKHNGVISYITRIRQYWDAIWDDFEGLIYLFLNCSSINSYTSPFSSLNHGYTFPFLGTNSFFTSIAWFYNFFISILSLAFFSKMWIYLWNLWETNFLAFFSDFAASFFSS